MTIWFDMDGTIADFYSVEGWLNDLEQENPRPYEQAKPLFSFSWFARTIHRLQAVGYTVGIVTWGSKYASDVFNAAVEQTKREWLAKHLPSVEWNEFCFMPYGVNKNSVNAGTDILFDDEQRNRDSWTGKAFDPVEIRLILSSLA